MEEQKGNTRIGKKAITTEQQRTQELEKQLWRTKRDNEILKKTAYVAPTSHRLETLVLYTNVMVGHSR